MAYKCIPGELRLSTRLATSMKRFTLKYLGLAVAVALVSSLPINRVQAASGDLDPSFSTDGKQITDFFRDFDYVRDIALQKDGKIVAIGYTVKNQENEFAVARYHSNGNLDKTFSGDGKVTINFGGIDLAMAVAIQSNGKIIVAGQSREYISGGNSDFALARLNSNGALDTSFSGDGKLRIEFTGGRDAAWGLDIQPDGKIVVAGSAETSLGSGVYDFALARYNSNGTPDITFDQDGKLVTDFSNSSDSAYDMALQPDGKIVLAGNTRNLSTGKYDFAVARYNSDGSPDTGFSGDGKITTDFVRADDFPSAVTIQPDNKILVAGTTRDANQNYKIALARYTVDGKPDKTFSGDGKQTTLFTGDNVGLTDLEVRSNGKIVAVGHTFETSSDVIVVRYQSNGNLDTTFSGDGKVMINFGGDEAASSMATQADGRIVIGGTFGIDPNSFDYDFLLARFFEDAASLADSPVIPPAAASGNMVEDQSIVSPASTSKVQSWKKYYWELPAGDSTVEPE